MDYDDKRRKDLNDSLRVIYERIAKLLAKLVLPIKLDLPDADAVHGDDVHAALEHAYTALQDMPMDESAKALIGMAILDWLMASDAMFDELQDPNPVNLRKVELQRHRIYKVLITLAQYEPGS